MEKMTVEEYDRFFCDRHAGCPFYKEYKGEEEYNYYQRLGAFAV
jgi:hypothetical protein